MPVPDVDSGMIWQGYNPEVFKGTKALPIDKTATNPFYFGGSQVPADLGITQQSNQQLKQPLFLQKVYKLPSIRK